MRTHSSPLRTRLGTFSELSWALQEGHMGEIEDLTEYTERDIPILSR